MLNKEIISVTIPSLHLTDTVGRAQELMNDFQIDHLPVIEDDKLVGLLSEDTVLNAMDDEMPLSQIQHEFSKISAHAGNHSDENNTQPRPLA